MKKRDKNSSFFAVQDKMMKRFKLFITIEANRVRIHISQLSRPAPGRDFTCCGGIPKFARGRGHGRPAGH